MPKKTPTPAKPSLAARVAFLAALDKHFPQLVQSLHEKVFTPHREQWAKFLTDSVIARALVERAEWLEQDGEIASAKSVASLKEWLGQNHIVDEWLYGVVLDNLRYWIEGGQVRAWQYPTKDQDIRIFAPREFGMWVPTLHTRQYVRKLWTDRFREELDRYLNDTDANWGTRPGMALERHTEWAVLRFMGMQPKQIMKLPSAHGYGEPEASIRTATDRLAASLGGLTFPSKKNSKIA